MKVRRVLQWRKWYKQRCGGWAVVQLGWSLGGMWEYSGEPSGNGLKPDCKGLL